MFIITLWRFASKISTAAAIDTFIESITFSIGMMMFCVLCLSHSSETTFDEIKKTEQVTKKIEVKEGILKDFNDYEIKGYEIHQGVTNISSPVICKDNVFATYIHGIFDNSKFTNDLLNMIRRKKAMPEQKEILSFNEFKEREYDKLAKLLRENLDMQEIYKILN